MVESYNEQSENMRPLPLSPLPISEQTPVNNFSSNYMTELGASPVINFERVVGKKRNHDVAMMEEEYGTQESSVNSIQSQPPPQKKQYVEQNFRNQSW